MVRMRNTCFRVLAFPEFPRDRVSTPSPHSTVLLPHCQSSPPLESLTFKSRANMSREDSPFVRAPAESEDYSSIHRAFLQAFQTHSVLTVDQMKAILAHVMTAYSLFSSPRLVSYSDSCNRPRTPMDRRRRDPTLHHLHHPDHKCQNRSIRLRDPINSRSAEQR